MLTPFPCVLVALLLAGAAMPDETVGIATREADGTIVLTLRAAGGDGAIGDTRFRYRPGDRDYAMIARHVGAIPANGSVPVRPFPDEPAMHPKHVPIVPQR